MDFEQDKLTEAVIAAVFRVHNELGPGFLESIYRKALLFELQRSGLQAETEKEVIIRFHGQEVGRHRLDLLVEQQVIIELKTVDCLARIHYAQVRSYLKATGFEVALLVNFAAEKADIRRVEQPPPPGQDISPISNIPSSPRLHQK